MGRRVLNVFLLVLLAGSLGLHAFASRDVTRRNVEFLPDMAYSPAYDSYAPNANFPDGKTLQVPEPGTIPRGQMPLHYGTSFMDILRAGEELHNPYSSDDTAALKRGAFIYTNYCQMCHGPEGKGDGLMVKRGIPLPTSFLIPQTVQRKDGELFHVLTYGQRNMSSQAAQLSREDRWKVILYVRSLQQKAAGEKRP
jgi:mono/diheme cytochrome c family protein